jgi:hypothetical protein
MCGAALTYGIVVVRNVVTGASGAC